MADTSRSNASTKSTASGTSDPTTDESQRVREQLAARLSNRGVLVHSHDTPDELGSLTEAVEGFEAAVEARGGDLMVDEPPAGETAEPDNPEFVLPPRASNESADAYISRIEERTAQLRV